jgi:hypothetical protein
VTCTIYAAILTTAAVAGVVWLALVKEESWDSSEHEQVQSQSDVAVRWNVGREDDNAEEKRSIGGGVIEVPS